MSAGVVLKPVQVEPLSQESSTQIAGLTATVGAETSSRTVMPSIVEPPLGTAKPKLKKRWRSALALPQADSSAAPPLSCAVAPSLTHAAAGFVS